MDSRDSFGRGTTGPQAKNSSSSSVLPHSPHTRQNTEFSGGQTDDRWWTCRHEDLQNYDCVYGNFMLSKLPSSLTTDSITTNRTATVVVGTLDGSGNQARKKHGSEIAFFAAKNLIPSSSLSHCSLRWSFLFDWMLMCLRLGGERMWLWRRTQTHPHTQVQNAQC